MAAKMRALYLSGENCLHFQYISEFILNRYINGLTYLVTKISKFYRLCSISTTHQLVYLWKKLIINVLLLEGVQVLIGTGH